MRRSARFEPLETRNLLTAATFVQGVGGYDGAEDTILYSITPTVNYGTQTFMSVDQQDVGGVRQGLLKFGDIFGSEAGQIPVGSVINSATLKLNVFNDSNASMQMSFYRMLEDWSQSTATWNSFGSIGGVQASEGEAAGLPPDAIQYNAANGTMSIDVARSLRHWATGEDNFGWLIESAATNGWDFNTSESASGVRPVLEVDYTAPAGAGSFQFLDLTPVYAEGDSGSTTYMLNVARLGGTVGQATVQYTIAAGGERPAQAGDFVAAGPTTLTFNEGIATMSIPVTITGDATLEGFENLTVTLSNPSAGASIAPGAGTAEVTIADDDVLINEVFNNVTTFGSQTVDESNSEYIELVGAPNQSLAGYYFVVFEGEEEENSGAGTGIADLVIDLSSLSFGSNGLLVITPSNWRYQDVKDAATAQFMTSRLDGTGGRIEDSSQTYALIKSPTPIQEGTDYDTVGAYGAGATAASSNDLGGVPEGLGILDSGPFDPTLPANQRAQLIDSVGTVEGGSGDRDRVLTTREAGHPGIHVHQPEGYPNVNVNASTAADGVSRRLGERLPNSIGVWFNGDVADPAAAPLAYTNGSRSISVTAPGGSVLTPGQPNVLRNVFFAEAAKQVDEPTVGTSVVSFQISRTDAAAAIDVGYTTLSNTAIAGQDFVAETGQIHFDVGQATAMVDVEVLTDSIAEGYEDFFIRLTSATSPFFVTVTDAVLTIKDGDVLEKSFQNGVDGYSGNVDTYLNALPADVANNFDTASAMVIDAQAGSVTGAAARPTQGLIQFSDLFGSNDNQVPVGSQIYGGFLTLNVRTAAGADAAVQFLRMLQAWDATTATWSDPLGSGSPAVTDGLTPNGFEAAATLDAVVTRTSDTGEVQIPLSRETLQAWSTGALQNFGWLVTNDSANPFSFDSSNAFIGNPIKPKLTIVYTEPTAAVGSFGFSQPDFAVRESGVASLTVNRVGGGTLSGPVTVNYAVTAGSGDLADISGSATGSITFNANELVKTISIPIVNDVLAERNETLNVTLSGAGLSLLSDSTTATLTIRDGDFNVGAPSVLLSEVYVNSPGNDGGKEFIELSGTANIGLGSLYLLVIDGDVGEGEGNTDLVIDVGAYANGANGTTIVTAEAGNFGFRVPTGSTQIGRPELNSENVANDTATYMLVYSPQTPLLVGSFDYDWDNNGSLDLPAGHVVVDSISIKDGGSLDQSYGPSSNIINTFAGASPTTPVVSDAISRLRGNTIANSSTAWFYGDLLPAGDDPLVYDPAPNSRNLPVTGAAMTPGEINTGSAVQSPLVSLTAVTPNLPVGTVTLSFNGTIAQFLDGGGAPGVSITNADGSINPQVDAKPTVAGLGTNSLTLSFTGGGVIAGQLPTGSYRLNFTGTSLIGNGRAVDTDLDGAADDGGSNYTFNFVQTAVDADFDDSSSVDGFDFLNWQRGFGLTGPAATNAAGNADGDADVDSADLAAWANQFGASTLAAAEPIVVAATPSLAGWVVALDGSTGIAPTAPRAAALRDAALERFAPPARTTYRDVLRTAAPAASSTFASEVETDGSDEIEADLFDDVFAELAMA